MIPHAQALSDFLVAQVFMFTTATHFVQLVQQLLLCIQNFRVLAEQGVIQLSPEPRQGPLWSWRTRTSRHLARCPYTTSFFSSASPKGFHSHLGELLHLPVFVTSIRMKLFEFHLNGILPLRD